MSESQKGQYGGKVYDSAKVDELLKELKTTLASREKEIEGLKQLIASVQV